MINAYKVLILGGTSEAFEIATHLKQQFPEIEAITSLAGRTKHPRTPPGQLIIGGFGGEIGISTNKLPPRGPVGINQLTSYKYIVSGKGIIRS